MINVVISGTPGLLAGIDLNDFWDDSDYSLQRYVEPAPSDELITSIEQELGFRLPDAYVELARLHNGGLVKRPCHPMTEPTGWAEDHIAISGLYAIGRTRPYSLCGTSGARFMRDEWEYPAIGFGIADTPSGGHEQIMLDYRSSGPGGEPQVVHVDQEDDYRITFVAPDFASFIGGLVAEDVYDDAEAERDDAMITVLRGSLSPHVRRALMAVAARLPEGEAALRELGRQIVDDKGHFSLHDDPRSLLMFDAIFWLFTQIAVAPSYEVYLDGDGEAPEYPSFVHLIIGGFTGEEPRFATGGYAPHFVRAWWDDAVHSGHIVRVDSGYRLAPESERAVVDQLTEITPA